MTLCQEDSSSNDCWPCRAELPCRRWGHPWKCPEARWLSAAEGISAVGHHRLSGRASHKPNTYSNYVKTNSEIKICFLKIWEFLLTWEWWAACTHAAVCGSICCSSSGAEPRGGGTSGLREREGFAPVPLWVSAHFIYLWRSSAFQLCTFFSREAFTSLAPSSQCESLWLIDALLFARFWATLHIHTWSYSVMTSWEDIWF